ncbi:tetratricopeptide repeat protein [Nitrobacter sp. TKz-YC02]|uniref:tetratricopeptide repeat protein n=1 Tax=Nitrobacter sp. TKz-YC02 TaxID=3398704 RepID=UPI003CF53E84
MNAPVELSAVSAAYPFPGLRPFAYLDHEFFFGRQDQIYALYRLIDRFRFIAVVGSSGSGKSSLVRAGLLPLIELETRETGGRNWVWSEMHPGDAPLLRLTNLLANLSVDDDPMVASGRRDRIAAQLHRSSFGISEALAEASNVAEKSLVLVIDQFEELFRYATGSPGKIGLTSEETRARDEATQFVQLLLEVSRSPSNRTHVLLTMRSDFIGDCARFHGLPEAVCEAQFLVPSPTRDQLDEVIRKPIEKAGATIYPQLVERLLNDCSTEMDQLPVLQHCLARLWEEAGKVPKEDVTKSGTSFNEQPSRRISLDHYNKIGEFAGALSKHADEILRDLPGPKLQLAVGQIFSSLSEFDKEGRATRRALKFSQLVAETGVDEATVRQVLDRFRADDCSFLTPPPFEVREINSDTRIDVGHEALLRRWDKVSGLGADLGWLRAEQSAGERYRSLLAMAEGDDAVLPAHLVDERLAWWKARPRTPAWADRYGGGFSRVERVLLKSQRRQRLKRWAIAAAFVVAIGVAGAMTALWVSAQSAQKEANLRREESLQATQTSIGRLAGFLNDGTVRAVGAEKFLADAKLTLDQLLKANDHSPEIAKIEISLLLAVSDVKDALGDSKSAFDLATDAKALSQNFTKRFPDDPKFKHLLYASKFRVGDQLAKTPKNEENAGKAQQEYLDAVDLARQLAASEPGNMDRQHELIVALNKVGDMHQFRNDWLGALKHYNEGLRIAQTIAAAFPGDTATEKNRIAQIFSARNQPGDKQAALDEYREALKLQTQQLEESRSDASLISNIATTHRRIGELLSDHPDEAQREFEAAVRGRTTLYQSDPGNNDWRVGLATDHTRLGDVLARKEDWRRALRSYNEAARIAEAIMSKDPTSTTWRRKLAALNAKRGDSLVSRANEVAIRPRPPQDEASRIIGMALERYRVSEQAYESLLEISNAPYRELFDVRIRIGDVLVRKNDYQEALKIYQSASELAQQAAARQPLVDWQIKLSNALEQAGDFLALRARDNRELASSGTFLVYYHKALEILDAEAIKEPTNQDLQSRKASLNAKLKAQ